MKRTILALSLAVALLAATASTASAGSGLYLWPSFEPSPRSFDFGDRQVGTTSPGQVFGLWVTGKTTINPRISVSGDFAQSNECPATLRAHVDGGACEINVTFTPTSTGPKHGTLSTGPGAPTATLTGNGVATPTPPAPPLTLGVSFKDQQDPGYRFGAHNGVVRHLNLAKKLKLRATTSNDSTLVARGDVKRTAKQLAAGNVLENDDEWTKFTARLKQSRWKQLKEEMDAPKPVRLRAKIKFKATDEFGQMATDEFKLKFLAGRDVCYPCDGLPRRVATTSGDPSL